MFTGKYAVVFDNVGRLAHENSSQLVEKINKQLGNGFIAREDYNNSNIVKIARNVNGEKKYYGFNFRDETASNEDGNQTLSSNLATITKTVLSKNRTLKSNRKIQLFHDAKTSYNGSLMLTNLNKHMGEVAKVAGKHKYNISNVTINYNLSELIAIIAEKNNDKGRKNRELIKFLEITPLDLYGKVDELFNSFVRSSPASNKDKTSIVEYYGESEEDNFSHTTSKKNWMHEDKPVLYSNKKDEYYLHLNVTELKENLFYTGCTLSINKLENGLIENSSFFSPVGFSSNKVYSLFGMNYFSITFEKIPSARRKK